MAQVFLDWYRSNAATEPWALTHRTHLVQERVGEKARSQAKLRGRQRRETKSIVIPPPVGYDVREGLGSPLCDFQDDRLLTKLVKMLWSYCVSCQTSWKCAHGNTEGLTGVEGGVQKVLWHCPDNQGHICLTEGGVGQLSTG